MAVLGGARLRTDALQVGQLDNGRSRAAAPSTAATPSRVRPMGLLMAGIVAATILGLVYLTQTLGSNATSSEIWNLEQERNQLQTQISRDAILVLQASDEDTIRTEARRLELKRLGDPVVLSAP